jgi:pterin-4a-carbinolamine dehydratase
MKDLQSIVNTYDRIAAIHFSDNRHGITFVTGLPASAVHPNHHGKWPAGVGHVEVQLQRGVVDVGVFDVEIGSICS